MVEVSDLTPTLRILITLSPMAHEPAVLIHSAAPGTAGIKSPGSHRCFFDDLPKAPFQTCLAHATPSGQGGISRPGSAYASCPLPMDPVWRGWE